MERRNHTIDAKNRSLGRLASEIAILLRGKNKPTFVPYKDEGDIVTIKNIEKMRITGRKIDQKKYYHYSGYSGGLKEIPLKTLWKDNPGDVLKRAVLGMLPKNKLRKEQIKRLRFQNRNTK